MMLSNVTLLNVQTTPMTLQIALPKSMSQPTMSPVLGSMDSSGGYVASVAICSGVGTDDGTSAAMLATFAGPPAPDGDGFAVVPPHAVSDTATETRTIGNRFMFSLPSRSSKTLREL